MSSSVFPGFSFTTKNEEANEHGIASSEVSFRMCTRCAGRLLSQQATRPKSTTNIRIEHGGANDGRTTTTTRVEFTLVFCEDCVRLHTPLTQTVGERLQLRRKTINEQ
jgi:hypothetical protein